MSNLHKILWNVIVFLLVCGVSSLQAAVVTYDYVINGDVTYAGTNAFGLMTNNTITASGKFTADLGVGGNVDISFGSGSGNTMIIDLNGTLLTPLNDDRYIVDPSIKPSLTFNAGFLTDFDFKKFDTAPEFNSNITSFDNATNGTMFGDWRQTVSLTAVPVPAAVWLFGSGLLGLAGIARKKMV